MTGADTTRSGTEPLETLSSGAVDVLDIAARLEASGMTDRMARQRHGLPDVFSLAATLHQGPGGSSPGADTMAASGLGEAVRRAVLLVAGVLLAAAVLTNLDLPPISVWVVGMSGWIGGQTVAAIAWTRLGWGQAASGLRRGAAATLLVLPVAAAAPGLVTMDAATAPASTALAIVWVAYATSVSLLVCARRTHLALAVVMVGLVLVCIAVLARQSWSPVAVLVAAALAAGVVVVLAVRTVLRAGRPALPDRIDWVAAAPAALQAALLATSLLLLLQTVPAASATPIVVASVVGAALADPAIAVLRARLRTSAGRIYAVALAARHARRAAVLAAASTALASALVAVSVVLVLQSGTPEWSATVLPAAAFTAVATTSAALTAFGAPWRAALAAASAVAYAVTALLSVTVAVTIVFPVALLGAVTLLLYRVSDPRVVA
jgi:hypothetical protein